MIEVEVLRGREPYDALKPDDLNDITRVVEVQGLWLGADQRQELRPGKPLPGNQPELFPQVSSSYHMQISLVPQEQFIKLPLEVLDHGLWQCNVHKAKHSGKRIVVLAGTVQALVMSAKVPEMHENTIGSQDIVRGYSLIVARVHGSLAEMPADSVLVSPLHELEEVRHVTEGQVVRKNP